MRDGERGGSQVPLIVCIVLLLAAGVWGYSQYSELEETRAALESIRNAARGPAATTPPTDETIRSHIAFAIGRGSQLRTRLEEIGAITGGGDEEEPELVVSPKKLASVRDKFLASLESEEFTIDFPTDRYIEDPSQGEIKVQAGAGGVTKIAYATNKDLRGVKPELVNVVEYICAPALRRTVAAIKRYRDAYIEATNAKDTALAAYKADLAAKDTEIQKKIQDLADLESRKGGEIAELRRQKEEAEAAKASADEEKNREVARLTAELKKERSRADEASSSVVVLKQRKRDVEVDTSPDGAILSVGDKQDFAVVDIGRSTNNLMAGSNFDVYAIGKGGMEIPKGVIKVLRTGATQSECAVVVLYDSLNPIVPGDKIRSLFYSPKETIHVAMVGRFQKMGKSDAARRLADLGVVVDEKVTIHTTYLVVGDKESESQPIEDTAEYKTATLYGIPTITEKELSKFTMY
jgi:hypothetical protein